jgi:hypothetical protein
MPKKGRARITGEHYTHRYLWHAAETLAEKGRADETGGVLLMAAMVFTYFAFEAFLNSIGPIACPNEWGRERAFFAGEGGDRYRGTLGKLHLLADRLSIELDHSRRPYQSVLMLDQRRDAVVHGRTEKIESEIVFKDPAFLKSIDPAIYAFADEAFLQRVFDDLEEIADSIQREAQRQLGEGEVWSPRAFRGMISQQAGSIIEMPTLHDEAV